MLGEGDVATLDSDAGLVPFQVRVFGPTCSAARRPFLSVVSVLTLIEHRGDGWHGWHVNKTAFKEARRPQVNELVEAIRRAVRAEINAAIAAGGPVSEARKRTSLAERMEVERCWTYATAIAAGVIPRGRNGQEQRMPGPPGQP